MKNGLAHMKDNVVHSKERIIRDLQNTKESAFERIQMELATLSEKLDEMSTDLRKRLRSVDHHVHEKPYVYLLGVGVLGVGLGWLAKAKRSSTSKRG